MSKNKINAVLGPTNTGKTFQAIETMLSFDSGMIGFPLRLLAREVYDKVVKKIDKNKVALITGEEKIIPSDAQYYLCTVESMPIDKKLDFVGIDEIQMCNDHERGHIFTERLLYLRGQKLTMFMGSNTVKSIISKLDEDIEFKNKGRLSKLRYSGHKKISRIERKSAIIAFSAEEVYAIAELIRRQKGGSAIVMGSLSPKTRNAQVNLYQSGDVDYLVATDAIGMGINMDLDNVYFSSLKKFDGKKLRRLRLPEIGQIAGRAGRHLNDGYFGVTGDCDPLNSEEVDLLEGHNFPEINSIFWRNSNLNFSSSESLIRSLEEKPYESWLRRIHECEDEKVLKYFLKDNKLYDFSNDNNKLKILWECCQIPDFVKKTYGHHYEVVKKVFEFLISKNKRIPNQYLKQQLTYLDKLDGNVDSISNRIANVRTWSYVTNKANWVENQDYWIERTKFLEDKLSDRLHEELTKSFIDKRASVLARGLKQDIEFKTKIIDEEKVMINNEYIGTLKGLKLDLDLKIGALDTDIKSLKKAARQNVGPEILKRIEQILNTGIIELKEDFKIYWKKFPIARIYPGKDYLNPKVDLLIDEMVENSDRIKLQKYLSDWIGKTIFENLESLISLKLIKEKNPDLRALAYHIYENNGVVKREEVTKFLSKLDQVQRKILRTYGLRFGRYHIFLFKLFKPNAVKLRILLWKNFHQKFFEFNPPTFGLNFVEKTERVDKKFMLLCGFEYFEKYFVRIDILERLFIKIMDTVDENTKEIKLVPEMLNLLGCNKENFLYLIKKMNYKTFERDNNTYFKYTPKKINKNNKSKNVNKDNPFNILNELNLK
tara:strand:+ start:18682 stop:21162 length:2481 start_codon:yes stop_codon:yes gene_type:complete